LYLATILAPPWLIKAHAFLFPWLLDSFAPRVGLAVLFQINPAAP